jgi:hypothetical protein
MMNTKIVELTLKQAAVLGLGLYVVKCINFGLGRVYGPQLRKRSDKAIAKLHNQ